MYNSTGGPPSVFAYLGQDFWEATLITYLLEPVIIEYTSGTMPQHRWTGILREFDTVYQPNDAKPTFRSVWLQTGSDKWRRYTFDRRSFPDSHLTIRIGRDDQSV